MTQQKKFLARFDEDIFDDLKKNSEKSGLSINKILNFKLKGIQLFKNEK